MNTKIDIQKIDSRIQKLKKTANELNKMGEEIPALNRNITRILASIKMLEMNFSDIADL